MKNKIFQFYEISKSENITLKSGIYLFEAWGAAGGGNNGGKGAYVSGIFTIKTEQTLQINIGGKGKTPSNKEPINIDGGFNGGGCGGKAYSDVYSSGSSGGGATDVRLNNSIDSRILVAAGGGGSSGVSGSNVTFYGGAGGADIGERGQTFIEYENKTILANQTFGYLPKGQGQNGRDTTEYADGGAEGNGGAGGGYWGGFALQNRGNYTFAGGDGGSSFIDNNFFSNTKKISGSSLMPLPSGKQGYGNSDNGYLKITELTITSNYTTFLKTQLFILHFCILHLNKNPNS